MAEERPQAVSEGLVPAVVGPRFERLRVFAYTVESLAPTYRAIMHLFATAKARYRIHFRPEEVVAALAEEGMALALPEGGIERALDQLVAWGNLRRAHDTERVATLEDFRRRHFLYQLTPAGEAAERAVGAVLEALASSGSLQTVMLGAIRRNLEALVAELGQEAPAPARLYECLFNVGEQFRALTENASTFMARLHEAIEAGEVHTDAFIVYKQAVIAYLEEFIGELAAIAPHITAAIRSVEAEGAVARLVALAAEADQAPTLEGRRDVAADLRRQWQGVAAWFVGRGAQPPTLELLRGAARAAINRILQVLERLHAKRFQRVDRSADLLRLAVAFEALEDDADDAAHRLFQAAFGLGSARHFGGLDEDEEALLSAESWWRTPPVPIAPTLRESGRSTVSGRAARVVDHAAAKRRLAARHRQARAAEAAALARFAGRGPLSLGALPVLSRNELHLLLALLDRLLAMPPNADGQRRTRSRDGRLRLHLAPAVAGEEAVVRSVSGRLRLPAYTLTVDDLAAPRAAVG